MTDHFALLNEPRRPSLDLEALKSKFLALASAVHPDRVHSASAPEKLAANQRYVELNAAYHCLREPRERLRHLLELELGAKPKQVESIPDGMMEWFVEVGQLGRDADACLAEKAKITSPLLQVQIFERGQELADKLRALQAKLHAQSDALIAELKTLNRAWETAPPVGASTHAAALPLEHLEQIYRKLSFFVRWSAQVQERIVQLSF
jgi:DnaJ-domain-containing protein 1